MIVKFFIALVVLFSSFFPCSAVDKQIYLTIDLCPSSHVYEAKLFNFLDQLGKQQGQKLPVAIAVSGSWVKGHEEELAQIKSKKHLAITWVNHSYSHPVKDDFLNNPQVNFQYEVLENIKVMQANGLKPSKYFRFPGLVHNQKRLAELKAMGYVNLDADAWLGKGQRIKNGSIVLIHGNGNEAPGIIDRFILAISQSKWQLTSLP